MPFKVDTWAWDDWDEEDMCRVGTNWAFVDDSWDGEWVDGHWGLFWNGAWWEERWVYGHYVDGGWTDWTWFIHPFHVTTDMPPLVIFERVP